MLSWQKRPRVYRAHGYRALPVRYRRSQLGRPVRLPVERKYVDYYQKNMEVQQASQGAALYGNTFASPLGTGCLNAVQQGTSALQRDGNVIVVTSVHLHGTVHCDAVHSGLTAPFPVITPTVLIALVLDLRSNHKATDIDPSKVFEAPGYTNADVDKLGTLALRNMDHISRYKILAFRRIRLFPQEYMVTNTDIHTTGYSAPFALRKSMRLPVTFGGNSGTVSDIQDHAIHVVAVLDYKLTLAAAPATNVSLNYNCRTRFVG